MGGVRGDLSPAASSIATALAGLFLLAGQQVINWIGLLAVAHKQRLYRQRFTGLLTRAGLFASVLHDASPHQPASAWFC